MITTILFIFCIYVLISGKLKITNTIILEKNRARAFIVCFFILWILIDANYKNITRLILSETAIAKNIYLINSLYYLLAFISIFLLVKVFQERIKFPQLVTPNESLWCSAEMWDLIYGSKIEQNEIQRSENKRNLHYVVYAIETFYEKRPIKILDSGCGVSLVPQILQYWGHDVMAIDLSQVAIDYCQKRTASEAEMANCIVKFIPENEIGGNYFTFEKDPEKLKVELLSRKVSGGKLLWEVGDIRKFNFENNKFELILNLNGLRLATTSEINEILERLFRLLENNGLVVATNLNCISRQDEIIEIAIKVGFQVLSQVNIMKPDHEKIVLREKSILFFWPTG